MNVPGRMAALVALLLTLSACEGPPESNTVPDRAANHGSDVHQVATGELPRVVAYRSPTCGCCELWVEHMRAAGFEVDVKTVADMGAVKTEVGVPVGGGSCHTARVGPYFVEGHVPASDIKRMLAEKPDAKGLTVPGMVPGSPGMEQGGVSKPYDVLLVAKDGTTTVFAHHGQ
jgi:hypothetical protein